MFLGCCVCGILFIYITFMFCCFLGDWLGLSSVLFGVRVTFLVALLLALIICCCVVIVDSLNSGFLYGGC